MEGAKRLEVNSGRAKYAGAEKRCCCVDCGKRFKRGQMLWTWPGGDVFCTMPCLLAELLKRGRMGPIHERKLRGGWIRLWLYTDGGRKVSFRNYLLLINWLLDRVGMTQPFEIVIF